MNVQRRRSEIDKENVFKHGGDFRNKRVSLPLLQKSANEAAPNSPAFLFPSQRQNRDDDKTTSRLGVPQNDGSGVSTASFRKAPFPIFGDSKSSENDQIMIRKRAEENATSTIKSSYLKDRDRNILMAAPATKKAKLSNRNEVKKITSVKKPKCLDKTEVKKTAIVKKPKPFDNTVVKKSSINEKPKAPVFPRSPKATKYKGKKETDEKFTTNLALDRTYTSNYSRNFIDQMISLDEKKKLSPLFLKRSVTKAQRCLIIKYLITVTTNCKYPSYTTYQAVKIFDSYIDKVDVKVDDLQTTALACLWIALKKDLISEVVPKAGNIIQISGNKKVDPVQYKRNLVKCELQVLVTLDFEVMFADPFSLLALCTTALKDCEKLGSEIIQNLYYYAGYMIDLALLVEESLKIAAVHLVGVVLEITLVLLSDKELSNPCWSQWRKKILSAIPGFKKHCLPDYEIDFLRFRLLRAILLSEEKAQYSYVCYEKYSLSRYGAVSKSLLNKVGCIKEYNSFY